MSNHHFLSTNSFLDIKVTQATAEEDARCAKNMWLRHPANKMTLAAVQKDVDANNDGLIDQDEFRSLLGVAGYTGGNADALFSQIDADGDGKLTEAEIKILSQGKDTLASGKVR